MISLSALLSALPRPRFSSQVVVERVTIPIRDLHPAFDGYRVVQLSDFHLYPFTQLDQVQQAVDLANSLLPDLTVLTGDYVSRDAEAIDDLAPVLAGLDARDGVFGVLGNHDVWSNREVVEAGLRDAGLPLMNNQGVTFSRGPGRLHLAGLDDGWVGRPDLFEALAGRPCGTPTLLLLHEPDLADLMVGTGQVALQLSGHTHGGQIRMPGRGALVLPHLGQKYAAGLYRVHGGWLYTNRGIGYSTAPVRINCPPEVTEITLVCDPV